MTLPHPYPADPFDVELEAGQKYFWCSCGFSQNQPFCDGAHKGSGLKSHCFTTDTSGKVRLCGCKKTKNPPFCDGSHMEVR